MAKSCSYEGCNNPVFSKGLCRYHMPKKQVNKISAKGIQKKLDKKDLILEDFAFYLKLWNEERFIYQRQYCYECGKGLSEPLTLYFHHLLPKESYPQFRHLDKNIAIICGDCHTQIHRDKDKVPKLKLLTEQLYNELC